jgi:hypothetical protein
MKIESWGASGRKKGEAAGGNQKSIDSTIFHIDDGPGCCKMLQVYKNKGGLKTSSKCPNAPGLPKTIPCDGA